MNFSNILKIEQLSTADKDIGFGGRILLVLEQQRRSKLWLAEQIGISKQAINYLLKRSSTPKYVNEIAAALEISPEWLMFGKGSQQVISEKNSGIIQIPILSSQDLPSFIKNKNISTEYTHISQSAASPACYATMLEDSSMEPIFSQGTLLIFNPDLTPKNGDYVIFSHDDGIFFRQYFVDGKVIFLKAVDTMYQTFKNDGVVILGVLIESRKHFK